MQRTLTEALFNLDAELHPLADIMRARLALKSAVTSARTQLYYCRTVQSTAALIERVITRELRIGHSPRRSDSDFSLTSVINNRTASCLGSALVHLAIAEPLHVPVLAVLYDPHVGLRFDGAGKSFNVDPCCGNLPLSTQTGRPGKHAIEGVPLTKGQLIAYVRVNRSTTRYTLCNDNEQALKELDSAIAFFPGLTTDRTDNPGSNEKGRI